MLFGCYRRGDANDPDTYVAAISAVLSRYEPELIREVTDPNTGIQTSERFMTFMPNAGELKVYCEGQAARRERLKRLGDLPAPDPARFRLPPPAPAPGDLASLFVPDGHNRYAALCEWSKTANPRQFRFGRASDNRAGIWIAWDIWDDQQGVTRRLADVAKTVVRDLRLSPDALKTMRDIDEVRADGLTEQAAE